MKTTKLILCFVAMATMLFAGCSKDNNGGNNNGNSSALVGTTWQLDNPHDEAYAISGDYHVIYTVTCGQKNEISFTRDISCTDLNYSATYIMTGTYTYSNGKGVAMIHTEDDPTDYRITFTVSGNTMIWNFNLRDLTLTKI